MKVLGLKESLLEPSSSTEQKMEMISPMKKISLCVGSSGQYKTGSGKKSEYRRMQTSHHYSIREEEHVSDEKINRIKEINDIDQQSSVHLGNLHTELMEAQNMYSAAKMKGNNIDNNRTFISQSLLSQSEVCSPGGNQVGEVTVVSYSDSSSNGF